MAATSWIPEALRPSPTRTYRMTPRFWFLIATVFVAALLLAGHSHIPSIETIKEHLPSKSPPPAPKPTPAAYPALDDAGRPIWDPPVMDALVHGTHVSDGIKKKPAYDLNPFPPSPMLSPADDDDAPRPWLAAVICPAWDIKRRMLIRYTWMHLYKSVPMDQRFVVSNPGPRWTELVRQENATFGDMIVLDTLPEDDFTANTVKTVEFYRWLRDKSPRKYAFVSKMDTDLFVNARGLWERHLLPRLDNSTGAAAVDYTVIGQFYYDAYHKTSFPHGAIYTVTWDVVTLLPALQDEFHVVAGEDVTMAWLLMKGRQKVTFAVLSESEKFEYDGRDARPGSAWAREGTDLTAMAHALWGPDVLAVHQLKKDEEWLLAAECFDEQGVKEMPKDETGPRGKDEAKPGYPRPFHTKIPDGYRETEEDGSLLCNGVWKLEPGVGKDMKRKGDLTGDR